MSTPAALVADIDSQGTRSATNPLGYPDRFCITADDAENLPLPEKPWPLIDIALKAFPPASSAQFQIMAWAWTFIPEYLKSARLDDALRHLEIKVSDDARRNLLRRKYTEIKSPLIAVLHHELVGNVKFLVKEGLV